MIIEATTKSGFKFAIDTRAISDYDFLENLASLMAADSDAETLPYSLKYAKLLLGDIQLKNLKDHLKKKNDGFADFNDVMSECKEISEILKEKSRAVKN